VRRHEDRILAGLSAFEREHHIEIARALLAKSNERLIFGRVVPSVESSHVREFNDDDASGFQ
jgi:hypothetical protein